MKYVSSITFVIAAASALSIGSKPQPGLRDQSVLDADQYLIELSPGATKWVTLDEKWELKKKGQNFMDITATGQTWPLEALAKRSTVEYPSHTAYNKTVKALAKDLNKDNMRAHLETFTAFHTRYYLSNYGTQSAEWLYQQVLKTVKDSGADKHGATVSQFKHTWNQPSIIAQIPGKSNKTIVIGAHQDSINLWFPSFLSAPGADDDGSGTVTILEALRVLLQAKEVAQGEAENTIEFHWYSAEEGGLLGSQAVFTQYAAEGRDVKAMLQQDMTGYVHKTIEAGKPESVGVITDFVDVGLTDFIMKVVTTYCDIPYTITKCGYACSDHASATKAGYPSAFVIESDMNLHDPKIHTSDDTIEFLSFDHMLQHSKLTLGLAYELVMATFE